MNRICVREPKKERIKLNKYQNQLSLNPCASLRAYKPCVSVLSSQEYCYKRRRRERRMTRRKMGNRGKEREETVKCWSKNKKNPVRERMEIFTVENWSKLNSTSDSVL